MGWIRRGWDYPYIPIQTHVIVHHAKIVCMGLYGFAYVLYGIVWDHMGLYVNA